MSNFSEQNSIKLHEIKYTTGPGPHFGHQEVKKKKSVFKINSGRLLIDGVPVENTKHGSHVAYLCIQCGESL